MTVWPAHKDSGDPIETLTPYEWVCAVISKHPSRRITEETRVLAGLVAYNIDD